MSIKYTFSIFYFCLFSLAGLSFETGEIFVRIHEESNQVQTAYRSYISTDGKTTVQLIGMDHDGNKSYYDQVKALFKNKTVIYELAGNSLEDIRVAEKRIAGLGEKISKRWSLLTKHAYMNALKCVSQNHGLSYDEAIELIHADDKKHHSYSEKFNPLSDEQLIELINELAKDRLLLENISYNSDDEINEKLNFLNEKKAKEKNALELSQTLRSCYKDLQNLHDNIMNGRPISTSDQAIVVDRNEFIYDALKKLFSREQVPQQIAVVYGAAHLPLVEKFLLELGFKPIKGSDGWLRVTFIKPENGIESKGPHVDNCDDYADKMSFEHKRIVRKGFVDQSSSTEIYLFVLGENYKGEPTNDDQLIKDIDNGELRAKYLALQKDLLIQFQEHITNEEEDVFNAISKGELEIVYSPANLPRVEEILLKNGFFQFEEHFSWTPDKNAHLLTTPQVMLTSSRKK